MSTNPNPSPTPAPASSATAAATPRVQLLNVVNVLAYALNTFTTYYIGVSGRFPTNSELSAKYQTIVTPAGYAFAIWSIIFISQLVWALAQLLPAFRASPLVVKGVGYKYALVCLAQSAWSWVFANEKITLSLLAMLSILVFLAMIVAKSKRVFGNPTSPSGRTYWVCMFPFEIHAGWILAASMVNANVVLVAWNVSPALQLIAACTSLVFLAMAGVFSIVTRLRVFSMVLSWALLAIYEELKSPRDSVMNSFSEKTIGLVQRASGGLSLVLLVGTFLHYVLDKRASRRTTREGHSYAAM